ncbi:MAG: I78 family peptidase inhibitor [Terricaulis sp.]
MIRVALASLVLLAACTQAPQTYRDLDQIGRNYQNQQADAPANAEQATAQDTCGLARFRDLIGTPASAIDQSTLPPRTRVIAPDTMVTQDFSPSRLNIMTGTDGLVSSMRCF